MCIRHGWNINIYAVKKLFALSELGKHTGARTLLGAPGIATRSKKLLGAPGLTFMAPWRLHMRMRSSVKPCQAFVVKDSVAARQCVTHLKDSVAN